MNAAAPSYATAAAKIRRDRAAETTKDVRDAGGIGYIGLDDVMSSETVSPKVKVAFGHFVGDLGERVVNGEITEAQLREATQSELPAGSSNTPAPSAPSPTPSPTPTPAPVPTPPSTDRETLALQRRIVELEEGYAVLERRLEVVVPLGDGGVEGSINVQDTVRRILEKVSSDKTEAARKATEAQTQAVNTVKEQTTRETEAKFADSVPRSEIETAAKGLKDALNPAPDAKNGIHDGKKLLGQGDKLILEYDGTRNLLTASNKVLELGNVEPIPVPPKKSKS